MLFGGARQFSLQTSWDRPFRVFEAAVDFVYLGRRRPQTELSNFNRAD